MRRRVWWESKPPVVNLGPMVDISLSLLIIFILAIPFIIESGLFVSKALVAPPNLQQEVNPKRPDVKVNVVLLKDGTIQLNGETVTSEELKRLVPQLLARSLSRLAILSADEEVVYDNVVKVIDLLKGLGAEDILVVKRKKE